MAKKNTKINNRYEKTTGESKTTIVFEKGCVMDYEELWMLLVNSVIAMKASEIIYAPSLSSSEGDKLRSNKKIIVEIKEA